jgi:hypothetical protein
MEKLWKSRQNLWKHKENKRRNMVALSGAGPALIFQGQHLTAEAAPAFAFFESWAPPASTLSVFVSGNRSKLHPRLVAIKCRYPAAPDKLPKDHPREFPRCAVTSDLAHSPHFAPSLSQHRQ